MEMELAAVRHGCKVCGKSFSSGRSLGGHMRSHLFPLGESAAASEGDAGDELAHASANGGRSSDGVAGYGLRENPRKTRRLSDFADDEVEGGGDGDGEHEACRVCGKLFPSWRSLFVHMRGHASGGRDHGDEEDVDVEEDFVPEEVEAEEAEMLVATMQAPVAVPALAAAPRRRRRTMRVAAPPPSPPPPLPVPCGFEKEPEDVALCLLMLSRDTGLWRQEPFESTNKRSRGRFPRSGNAHNSEDDAMIKGRVPKGSGRKRRSPPAQQKQGGAVAPKRTRYECPGCGKVFSSYQALGGHRASHKRINTSCSAPKVSSPAAAAAAAPEPSAETYASFSTMSPSASPDSVAIGFGKPNAHVQHKLSHLVPADGGELYAGVADQEQEQQHSAGFLDLNFPPAPPEEA
ncbi:unnamed protein product [Urochloa humidicola]